MSVKFPKSVWLLVSVLPLSAGQMCGTKSPLPGDDGGGGNNTETISPGAPLPPPLPLANREIDYPYALGDYGVEDLSGYTFIDGTYTARTQNDYPTLEVGVVSSGGGSVAWLKFNLANLPPNPSMVTLSLFTTANTTAGQPGPMFVDRLASNWSEAGSSTIPTPPFPQFVPWGHVDVSTTDQWIVIDITPLYLGWIRGDFPNYGIQLRADTSQRPNGLWNTFYSSEYPGRNYQPWLIQKWIETGPSRFHFPLDNGYNRAISGYHFGCKPEYPGDCPWEDKYCTQSGMKNVLLVHTGVDLKADIGNKVYAADRGFVKYAGSFGDGWANVVVVQHDDYDRNITFETVYGHIDYSLWIEPGVSVMKGELIGTVAKLTNAGSHLHFGVRHGVYNLNWSVSGRLPQQSCTTAHSPSVAEPAWPENFSDPEGMLWK